MSFRCVRKTPEYVVASYSKVVSIADLRYYFAGASYRTTFFKISSFPSIT
jgi:hypothetical protein